MINNKFKGKLRRLLEDVRGEWWIDESGNAEYADIDIGDSGHEGIVINRLLGQFLNYFDIDTDMPKGMLDSYIPEIKLYLIEEEEFSQEQMNKFEEDEEQGTYDYLISRYLSQFKDEKQFKYAFSIAWGNSRIDPREYGLIYWNWKRMKGNNIETYNLTTEDLNIISRGIGSAYDDIEDTELFNIDVRNSRMYFTDVPITVIDEANVNSMLIYGEKY